MAKEAKCVLASIVVGLAFYFMLAIYYQQHNNNWKNNQPNWKNYQSDWKNNQSNWKNYQSKWIINQSTCNYAEQNISDSNIFTLIPHSEILVRDVFIDRRFNPPRITILALAPVKRRKIYCHAIYSKGSKTLMKESHYFYLDGVVRPYCYFKSYYIHCQLNARNKNPQFIGLSVTRNTEQLVRKPNIVAKTGVPKQDLGMCLPKIFGMDDAGAEKIIEFIELYRILGIKHAILYDVENSTSKVVDAINYYMGIGFLSLIPWKPPIPNLDKAMFYSKSYVSPNGTEPGKRFSNHHPQCTRRHAQLLSNYHCHLSNIHRFKYLAYPDLDEIFLPRKHHTLPQLLHHLEKIRNFKKYASIVFSEAYFCLSKNKKQLSGNRTSLTLFSNERTPIDYSHSKSPKTIIRPDKTDVMTIHAIQSALKGYERRYFLGPDLGTKNHYRVPNYCRNNSKILTDNILLPYLSNLERKVKLVKSKIGKGNKMSFK